MRARFRKRIGILGRNVKTPTLIAALKPSLATLGYGLFLAINAASVWGGVFPFLPMDFQTPEVLRHFFVAQSLTFTGAFIASALGTYLFPMETRRFMVKAVASLYISGWALLIGAIYLDNLALPLVTAGGALLGVGSAGFYMLWQRLFASMEPHEGNTTLIAGTAWGSLFYFALHLIPVAVTAYLIPLVFLPLFGLAIVLTSRTIRLDQPMFEDVPREHPRTYRHVVSLMWRTALAMGALGFCTGIMRSLAVAEPSVGTLVNMLSMVATFAAALALLAMMGVKNIHLNVEVSYRVFFPLVTSAFLFLPLLGVPYTRGLAAVLYALWSVVIMLMMIQCAQMSRDGGINPVFIYGLFGGIVYALHDVGFVGGSLVEHLTLAGIPSLALVAIVAVYFLGIMYFVGQGGFRSAIAARSMGQIELLSDRRRQTPARPGPIQAPQSSAGKAGSAPAPAAPCAPVSEPAIEGTASPEHAMPPATIPGIGPATSAAQMQAVSPAAKTHGHPESPYAADDGFLPAADIRPDGMHPRDGRGRDELYGAVYRDRFSKQMAMVREHFALSARETEVAELIARGNSVARIAEILVVSENTVRTHSKRIYTKLGIHKRQELIELVEEFDPRAH